jgi:lipopolysaccharide export LptBFGC system permease protein LptF
MANAAPAPSSSPVPLSPRVPGASHFRSRRNWAIHLWDLAYAREMLVPMMLGMMALVLALAGNFVYWALNSIISQGMSATPILKLFVLAAPGFAVQGIPIGVILAVCLVLNRAVRDNEIIALRASGVGLGRIVAPFMAMALLASLFNYVMIEKIIPRTNDLANKTLMTLMSRAAIPLMQADKYFRVGPYYFYVRDVDPNTHELRDVMIYERGGTGPMASIAMTPFPTVYLAKTAKENRKVPNQWILTDVTKHFYDEKGVLRFSSNEEVFKLNLGRDISTYWGEDKEPFAMTSDELSQRIQDLSQAAYDQNKVNSMKVDYYRRSALAIASLMMAWVAAPMALRFARHGSFAGLVLAFALAFFYQGFEGWFRALGIAYPDRFPPFAAAWMTNVMFFFLGGVLLWRER